MKNFREIENLSAYLDGQLDSTESARLESRLKSDPELESALRDLSAARNILRKLPARKAPRNFTLTRKMVGLKPPMPRTYPLFRLATVFAAVLFVFSFSATALSPYFNLTSQQPQASVFGMGGGGDAAMEESAATEEAFAAEMAPAAEAPAAEATLMPDMPMEEAAPYAATEDPARLMETPSAKEVPSETGNQPDVQQEAQGTSFTLPIVFLILSIVGAVSLWLMQRSARNKWQ